MSFPLIELPYPEYALEPTISAETLAVHHGKHHKAYIDKTNTAIAGTDLADAPLETVIATARGGDRSLFNNAGQAWNHGFYWNSLSPDGGTPTGELAEAIDAAFGGLDALKQKLADAGAGHFASGWVWLAEQGGRLSVEQTHDGDTLADSRFNPLLTIDLWEHAYYLDHKNERPAYLKGAVELLNWRFAAVNLARRSVWNYPAEEAVA
jgi:Fe-Mn family superoxide dismutase